MHGEQQGNAQCKRFLQVNMSRKAPNQQADQRMQQQQGDTPSGWAVQAERPLVEDQPGYEGRPPLIADRDIIGLLECPDITKQGMANQP